MANKNDKKPLVKKMTDRNSAKAAGLKVKTRLKAGSDRRAPR